MLLTKPACLKGNGITWQIIQMRASPYLCNIKWVKEKPLPLDQRAVHISLIKHQREDTQMRERARTHTHSLKQSQSQSEVHYADKPADLKQNFKSFLSERKEKEQKGKETTYLHLWNINYGWSSQVPKLQASHF